MKNLFKALIAVSILILAACGSSENTNTDELVIAPRTAPDWAGINDGKLPTEDQVRSGEYRMPSPKKCLLALQLLEATEAQEIARLVYTISYNNRMPKREKDAKGDYFYDFRDVSVGHHCGYRKPDGFRTVRAGDDLEWNVFMQHFDKYYEEYRKADYYMDTVLAENDVKMYTEKVEARKSRLEDLEEIYEEVMGLRNKYSNLNDRIIASAIDERVGNKNAMKMFAYLNDAHSFDVSFFSGSITVEYNEGESQTFNLDDRKQFFQFMGQSVHSYYINLESDLSNVDSGHEDNELKYAQQRLDEAKTKLEQAQRALQLELSVL